MSPRTIAVVTGARSDYSIYYPILKRLSSDPQFKIKLLVSGSHLLPSFGYTIQEIEKDGFEIFDCIDMLLATDTPESIAKSTGLQTVGFAQALARLRPDLLMLLGDRFEMLAAASAALPFRIPVAHIHGGELTQGAIDDAIRHAVTKMSHLHFTSTEAYAQRILQLGEEDWRVTVCGAPALEALEQVHLMSCAEVKQKLAIDFDAPLLLVTYHPVTLEFERTAHQIQECLSALACTDYFILFTYPNVDTANQTILEAIKKFIREYPKSKLVPNLGRQLYYSVMAIASAMVGNSSSGIIEAPSFKLPVVNIGNRQSGRMRAQNVIDVPADKSQILAAIQQAVSIEFRESLHDLVNPYYRENTSETILRKLKNILYDNRLMMKQFIDYPIQNAMGVTSCRSNK